jgi:uncharacterized protein YozE (UPF0346 family)
MAPNERHKMAHFDQEVFHDVAFVSHKENYSNAESLIEQSLPISLFFTEPRN